MHYVDFLEILFRLIKIKKLTPCDSFSESDKSGRLIQQQHADRHGKAVPLYPLDT